MSDRTHHSGSVVTFQRTGRSVRTTGVLSELKRLLGLLEAHEGEVAKTVGERTSASEEQAGEGLDRAEEAAGNESGDGSGDQRGN